MEEEQNTHTNKGKERKEKWKRENIRSKDKS